jgi:hypothetical protein
MSDISTIRKQNLIALGIYLATKLRADARKRGIPCLEEFLIGLVAGSVMIGTTIADHGDLTETIHCESSNLENILASKLYRQMRSKFSHNVSDDVIGDPVTPKMDLAALTFFLAPVIARDFGATSEDLLKILAFAIMVTSTIHFSKEPADAALEHALELISSAEQLNPESTATYLSGLLSVEP